MILEEGNSVLKCLKVILSFPRLATEPFIFLIFCAYVKLLFCFFFMDGRDVWNSWGFVCFCFHSLIHPVSWSFSLNILTLPTLWQKLQAMVYIYQLFRQFKTKFLKLTNSFTSSYSGYQTAIIKDDLMFFLKAFVKEEKLALRKASNLEPVLMVALRWGLQASQTWRCSFFNEITSGIVWNLRFS